MNRSRRYHKAEDDDKFETEVFASFNEKPAKDGDDGDESGSDENIYELDSEEEPDDEDLLDQRENSEDSEASEVVSLVHSQDKEKRKDVMQKRAKHNQMSEEQKKRKLEQLEQAKLPEDFLEALDAKIPKKKSKKMTKSVEGSKEAEISSSAVNDEAECNPADGIDTNFIPLEQKCLDRTGVVAVTVREKDEHLVTLSGMAAEYRQKLLYGRRIYRETSKVQRAKKLKRRSRFR